MTVWAHSEATSNSALDAAREYVARINTGMLALDNALRAWIAARRMQRLDDAALKDIGIGRGGIDWAASNGRDERR